MTIVALLLGLACGLVALVVRRRLRDIPLAPVRWPALLVVAVLVYRAPAWLDASGALALGPVLAAYAGLVVFAAANLRLRGMMVVLVGLACNAAVLVVNGAMPVDEEAVVAAGVARAEELPRIDLEPPREWRAPEHRLVLLSDIIPVPALREVVSFGDLILAVGLANLVFRLLPPLVGPPAPSRSPRPGGRRRRKFRRRQAATEVPQDFDDFDDFHDFDHFGGVDGFDGFDGPERLQEPHEAHDSDGPEEPGEPEASKEPEEPEAEVPRDPAG
ncbi:MAG TPA: DUF5317 family protein [Acidimicrobiales bacterium]|nr:DUF5317 family protein [Acidimicrobiales bacterium]